MRDLTELPARLLFAMLYCLLLDETQDRVERRQELDSQLASAGMGVTTRRTATGRPDRSDRARRAAMWGKAPEQQRAMRNAMQAGGRQANVAGRRRREG